MNLFSLFLVVFFFVIATPLCSAEKNPTVDFNANVELPDNLLVDMVINNPGETDIYLKGLQLSISDPVGESSSTEAGTPQLIKAKNSITEQSRHQFCWGDSLRNFYLTGSTNVIFSGVLFFEKNGKDFSVPFQKDVKISIKTEGAIKTKEPEITAVNYQIDKLADSRGKLRDIIVTTNISVHNPNTVPFILKELDYEVFAMDKIEEKLKLNCSLPGYFVGTNEIVEPGDTYIYSGESRIEDGDAFQYFSEDKPRYIRIKGTSVLVANQSDCNPCYFEPKFSNLVVLGEGNGNETHEADIKLESKIQDPEQNNGNPGPDTKSQSADGKNVSIPQKENKSTPGFEIVYGIISLLGVFLFTRNINSR